MKLKAALLCLIFCVAFSAGAQDFRNFRVGTGIGYAAPAGKGSKSGVLFYLEPGYRINDRIIVGLRVEGAVMARTAVVANFSGVKAEGKVSANASYTVNGQYYFSDKVFRPFAGLGFGVYKMASVKLTGTTSSSTSTSSEVSEGAKFGLYPRIGFDFTHLVFQIEYNLIPKTNATVVLTDTSGNTTTTTSVTKNNYLGVKLGFFLGGGKRWKK